MTTWIFTFGYGQRLRSTSNHGEGGAYTAAGGIGLPLHNRYVRIPGDFGTARQRMAAIFGPVWSMEYSSEEAAGVEEYGLVELDISEVMAELDRDRDGVAEEEVA